MAWNVNIYHENDSTAAELWSRTLGTDQKNELTFILEELTLELKRAS